MGPRKHQEGVADDDAQASGAGEGDVEASFVGEEAQAVVVLRLQVDRMR